jgi:hypothetical protein
MPGHSSGLYSKSIVNVLNICVSLPPDFILKPFSYTVQIHGIFFFDD